MKNIHLIIQYGCDDRRELTKNTIEVCKNYFKSIFLVNCGSVVCSKYFEETYKKDVIIYNIPYFFGDLEPSKRAILKFVPQGDWFLHLDSDETPSFMFLNNLNKTLEKLESENKNCCRMPWKEHFIDKNGLYQRNDACLTPKTWEDAIKIPGFYSKRLIKNIIGWEIKTNFGMHEEFINKCESFGYCSYPIIHKKSAIQCAQSVILSSYSMPSVHINPTSQDNFFKSEEYNSLTEFKRKTKIKTSNDLVYILKVKKDENFKKQLIELILSYKDSIQFPFSYFKNFLEFDCDFETPHHFCGEECCKYGDLQL